MRKGYRVLLAILAVVCFAVALSYPIRYRLDEKHTGEGMAQLIAMRDAVEVSEQNPAEEPSSPQEEAEPAEQPDADSEHAGEAQENAQPQEPVEAEAAPVEAAQPIGAAAAETANGSGDAKPAPDGVTEPAPAPTINPERYVRQGGLPYPDLEKRTLNEDEILSQYRQIYALNHDMVGWLTIADTVIDYPVVQSENSEFYLTHDFFGDENNNGQIIMDPICDPYTPSYNLIISGHNMRSDLMFGTLDEYRNKSYWSSHKIVRLDSLMERREYVVIAAFYSADYNVDEEGFRYNTDIQYRIDAVQWLQEVRENQLYDVDIDADFGDEFLTLTTCNKSKREDGRFVVVCRRIREGEEFT